MKQKVVLIIALFMAAMAVNSQTVPAVAKKVQGYMPPNAVIAHRGTIYWAPENTEAAYRWARNTGADYLELDVHRTKDGVLIIMHDKTFKRTTDVSQKFPGRENDPISAFTYEEIMKLDNGSAFNAKNTERARAGYTGLDVPVFEDVFRIAEGKRIKRNADGSRIVRKDEGGKYTFEYENDPADNGHRPGVYIEVKNSEEYPGIEEQIYAELALMGWNPLEGEKISDREPFCRKGKVNAGNTKGKILVQTFSRQGTLNFKRVFREEVLCSFLTGNPKTDEFAKDEVTDEIIDFAISSGAQFIGTNMGDTNDGLSASFAQKIHAAGLKANIYSINTIEQMEKYFGPGKGKESISPCGRDDHQQG